MQTIAKWLLVAACLASAPALAGETLFITDQVLADLYASRDARQPVGRLPTGTRVEVLQKVEGYARIRLPGGDEGWIEARWLSDREPAQVALLRLADEYARLKSELSELRQRQIPVPELQRLRELPLWSLLALGGGGLLVGFIVGAAWLDRRYRDRHGGFRL